MPRPLILTAASEPANVLHLSAALGSDQIDTSTRTIAGEFIRYGVVGYTSRGPTIFVKGSLTVPDDLRRVKLLVQHDQYSPAVGYMTEFSDTAEAATGAWHVPDGDQGTDALVKAGNGLRDGLSLGVRLQDWTYDTAGNVVVTAATLYEVSLVTIPAYDDARVLDVAASRKDTPHMFTKAELDAMLAAGSITAAQHTSAVASLEAAATPTPKPAPPAPAPAPEAPAERIEAAAQADPVRLAVSDRAFDLSAAIRFTEEHLAAGRPVEALTAALSDVTSTTVGAEKGNANGLTGEDVYLGELWRASRVRRPLIEAAGTPKPLTGLRAYGWHWEKTPTVAEYAGEKKDIASDTWKIGNTEAEAQPFAGGWDVERKLIDLGAPGIVDTAFTKAVEDYKLKTEVYASRLLRAAATDVGDQSALTSALSALGVRASRLGASIGFVQFGAEAWAEFTEMKEADAPWWLRSQGSIDLGTTDGQAGGMRFAVNPDLGDTELMAGDSRAYTFYEVPVPIKVRAENIPKGGVDLGVFGYAAMIVNDKRAIFRGSLGVAGAEPATV